MRHLRAIEMVVIRGALRTKKEHLDTYSALEPDPTTRAEHRKQLEAVKRLLKTFGAGNRIVIPFEDDGFPQVKRPVRR